MGQNRVSSVDEPLKDNWRWVEILENIGKIAWEVCVWEGEDRSRCFLDIWSPGFPAIDVCYTHGPFKPGGPYFTYEITPQQRTLAEAISVAPFGCHGTVTVVIRSLRLRWELSMSAVLDWLR